MSFLPVCLNIEQSRILVVGGGKVALQKLRTLLQYTRRITVCAPSILEEIKALPVSIVEKPYAAEMLHGISLVYACTDDGRVNRKIKQEACELHILTCVADDPQTGDFVSPAVYKQGRLSVAVSSNGEDVRNSIAWRNRIKKLLSEDA